MALDVMGAGRLHQCATVHYPSVHSDTDDNSNCLSNTQASRIPDTHERSYCHIISNPNPNPIGHGNINAGISNADYRANATDSCSTHSISYPRPGRFRRRLEWHDEPGSADFFGGSEQRNHDACDSLQSACVRNDRLHRLHTGGTHWQRVCLQGSVWCIHAVYH
jgi:hypothetical protein